MSTLQTVDDQLGGQSLTEKEIGQLTPIVEDQVDYLVEHKSEVKSSVNEIVQLLSVNEGNIKKVEDQNWFQRAWGTVSGGNRRLKEYNSQNLQKVQKVGISIISELEKQNMLTRDVVVGINQKVNDLAQGQLEIKSFMVAVLNKVSARFEKIEGRVSDVEAHISFQYLIKEVELGHFANLPKTVALLAIASELSKAPKLEDQQKRILASTVMSQNLIDSEQSTLQVFLKDLSNTPSEICIQFTERLQGVLGTSDHPITQAVGKALEFCSIDEGKRRFMNFNGKLKEIDDIIHVDAPLSSQEFIEFLIADVEQWKNTKPLEVEHPEQPNAQIEDQTDSSSIDNLSDEEKKYVEEINFCLEDDGMIDDKERRMLEKDRKKFGISEARAQELENMVLNDGKPSSDNDLTDEEKQYVDEIKFCLEDDGKIDEQERRILERNRKKFGISEERAKELEKSYVHSNSNINFLDNGKNEPLTTRTSILSFNEKIVKLFKFYTALSNCNEDDSFWGEHIPKNRVSNLAKECGFNVIDCIAMIDNTVFGNGKLGLAICNNGIFVNNAWTALHSNGHVSWETFKNIEINPHDDHIDYVWFGNGFTYDRADCGHNKHNICNMLRSIQNCLNGTFDENSFSDGNFKKRFHEHLNMSKEELFKNHNFRTICYELKGKIGTNSIEDIDPDSNLFIDLNLTKHDFFSVIHILNKRKLSYISDSDAESLISAKEIFIAVKMSEYEKIMEL